MNFKNLSSGQVISACLCISLCRTDYIFTLRTFCVRRSLACSLYGFLHTLLKRQFYCPDWKSNRAGGGNEVSSSPPWELDFPKLALENLFPARALQKTDPPSTPVGPTSLERLLTRRSNHLWSTSQISSTKCANLPSGLSRLFGESSPDIAKFSFPHYCGMRHLLFFSPFFPTERVFAFENASRRRLAPSEKKNFTRNLFWYFQKQVRAFI